MQTSHREETKFLRVFGRIAETGDMASERWKVKEGDRVIINRSRLPDAVNVISASPQIIYSADTT
jgi:hypothetical protein